MSKTEISLAEKRMLEGIRDGFPALALEFQDKLKAVQSVQQRIAAHASMLSAYGWPIPEVEGLTIQSGPVPPEALQQAFLQAAKHGEKPVLDIKQATAVTPPPERMSARKLVHAVLQDGSELTVAELREVIKEKHGQILAAATVYRILSDRDIYANDSEGKWRIKK